MIQPSPSVESSLSTKLNQRAEQLGHRVVFTSNPKGDLRTLHKPTVLVQDFSTGTPTGKVLEQTYDSLLRYRPTLAIGHDPDTGKALIITLEKGVVPVANYERLLIWLDKLLLSRASKSHYDTDTHLNKVEQMPETIRTDLDELKSLTESWANWSLFPKFQLVNEDTGLESERYPGARFGFVAKRTSTGTLITARGSNKGEPSDKDFALVTKVERQDVHTTSLKSKASLNAPLAHKIFESRPEIHYIVHSHILLPEGVNAPSISSPDTEEDWESVAALVKNGATIINQPQHGTLILLEKAEDLLDILKRNNLYEHRSDLYELAYYRFLEANFLERTIEGLSLPKDTKVLDLCCGTGASTKALKDLGFSNIDIADGSQSMLAEAQMKTGTQGTLISLPSLDPIQQTYDLISMRQAFNYVKPEDLDTFASNISRKLNPGGKFVFNTFVKLEPGLKYRDNPDFESDGIWTRTHEIAHITKDQIMQTQRSEIIDYTQERWHPVLNINTFYQYDIDQIKAAFEKVGMRVACLQEGTRLCFVCEQGEKQ